MAKKTRQKAPGRADLVEAERRAAADEEVQKRAYFLYIERGRGPGDQLDDWLRAERELRTARE